MPVEAPPVAPAAPAAQAKPGSSAGDPITPPPDTITLDAQIDADLAALDEDAPKPAQQPPPQPESKQSEQKPEVQPKPEKQGETKTSEQSKEKEEPPRPGKASILRNAYEELKKKVRDEYEPRLQELQSKLKEVESKQNESDSAVLTEQLDALKKERDALRTQLSEKDYETDPEYQDKYVKPYVEAWRRALADLAEIEITNEDGSTRAANKDDLILLAQMPLGQARQRAKDLFGEAADDIMAHRRVIKELSDAQRNALENAKAQSTERQKQLTAKRQIEHQQTIKLWSQANQELAKKFPNWFSPKEGDQEGNALLEKGFALADGHFVGLNNLTPQQVELLPPHFRDAIKTRGRLSPQEQVTYDALLRNKIASHSRIALQLKNAHTRIKELEEALAEYEKSEPKGGKGGTADKGPKGTGSIFDEAAAELDAIDAKFQ